MLHYSIAPSPIAGFPLASTASRQATEPQGPTAQLQKLAAERGIKTMGRRLQVDMSRAGGAPSWPRSLGDAASVQGSKLLALQEEGAAGPRLLTPR